MSFSGETKLALIEKLPTKECCRRAMLSGMFRFSTFTSENICVFKSEIEEISLCYATLLHEITGIEVPVKKVRTVYQVTLMGREFADARDLLSPSDASIKDIFSCQKCDDFFFRGAFLASGFVNPPEKPRLELSTASADLACDAAATLTSHFRLPKLSVRRGNQIIYFRDAESVHYFLSYIGAKKEAFDVINAKMLREKNNEVNRKQNFDIANLSKTVYTAGIYVDAILALMESGDFERLPPELKVTAKNRVTYDTMTLQELADIENPPLSKSQISKRLQKIYKFYEETLA
ncbi:MAG: DNA-binding protein WhiA [Clostridia bacterium]|nr:DNA-binding protein WhiA [Clostridia bacterium]